MAPCPPASGVAAAGNQSGGLGREGAVLPRAIDSFDGEGFFPSFVQQLGVEIPPIFLLSLSLSLSPLIYTRRRKRFRPCVRGEQVRRHCLLLYFQTPSFNSVALASGEEKKKDEKERKKVLSSRGMRRWHSCFCCRMLPENEGDRFTTRKGIQDPLVVGANWVYP